MGRAKVFISSCEADRLWLDRLRVHLRPLEQQGLIACLDSTQISPGMDVSSATEEAMRSSRIAVLMLSANFFADEATAQHQLPPLLSARATGLLVIPMLLSPYMVMVDPELARLRPINPDGKFLSALPHHEQEQVLAAVATLLATELRSSAPPPIPRGEPSTEGGYHRADYVPRLRDDKVAQQQLEVSGAPVLVRGPRRCGKTWFLRHLVASTADAQSAVAMVDLSRFSRECTVTLDSFSREFAHQLVTQTGGRPESVDQVWSSALGPGVKLRRLLESTVLTDPRERVILAIDAAEALFLRSYEGDFFGFLRSWADRADRAPWHKLRMVVALTASASLLVEKAVGSPFFNRVFQIRLMAMDAAQMGQLVQRCGLSLGPQELADLCSLSGGSAYLARRLLDGAQRHRLSPGDVLSDPETWDLIFLDHLKECDDHLLREPALVRALGQVLRDPHAPLAVKVYEELHLAGYVEQERTGAYLIPAKLYVRHFRKLCKLVP